MFNKLFVVSLALFCEMVFAQNLGRGYDSATGKYKEICVEGKVDYHSDHQMILDYSLERSELASHLDISGRVTGGINLMIAAGSLETTIRNRINRDEYSYYFAISYDFNPGTRSLSEEGFNEFGKHAFNYFDEQSFQFLCGDHYIQSWTPDLKIHMITRYDFANLKNIFDVTMKFKIEVLGEEVTRTERQRFSINLKAIRSDSVFLIEGFQAPRLKEQLKKIQGECESSELSKCLLIPDLLSEYLNSYRFDKDLASTRPPLNSVHLSKYSRERLR